MVDKDEIFNYVMETPGNTNPSVLRDMLNRLDSEGGMNSFIVPLISEGKNYTATKTYGEIFEAASEGKLIVLKVDDHDDIAYFYPHGIYKSNDEETASYSIVMADLIFSSGAADSYPTAGSEVNSGDGPNDLNIPEDPGDYVEKPIE